jgi:hypothetical protein
MPCLLLIVLLKTLDLDGAVKERPSRFFAFPQEPSTLASFFSPSFKLIYQPHLRMLRYSNFPWLASQYGRDLVISDQVFGL